MRDRERQLAKSAERFSEWMCTVGSTTRSQAETLLDADDETEADVPDWRDQTETVPNVTTLRSPSTPASGPASTEKPTLRMKQPHDGDDDGETVTRQRAPLRVTDDTLTEPKKKKP